MGTFSRKLRSYLGRVSELLGPFGWEVNGRFGVERCSGLVPASIADLITPAVTSLEVATLISLFEVSWVSKAANRLNECSQDSSSAYITGKLS